MTFVTPVDSQSVERLGKKILLSNLVYPMLCLLYRILVVKIDAGDLGYRRFRSFLSSDS